MWHFSRYFSYQYGNFTFRPKKVKIFIYLLGGLTVFSFFFRSSKNIPIGIPRTSMSARLSVVRGNVYFRGKSRSDQLIDLKVDLNIGGRVVHVQGARFFEN